MGEMTSYAIKVSIAGILVAVLMPVAIGLIANATLTGADSTVILVFQTLLPILMVLGLALAFMPPSLKGRIGLWTIPYDIPASYTYAETSPKSVQTEIYAVANFEAIG